MASFTPTHTFLSIHAGDFVWHTRSRLIASKGKLRALVASKGQRAVMLGMRTTTRLPAALVASCSGRPSIGWDPSSTFRLTSRQSNVVYVCITKQQHVPSAIVSIDQSIMFVKSAIQHMLANRAVWTLSPPSNKL